MYRKIHKLISDIYISSCQLIAKGRGRGRGRGGVKECVPSDVEINKFVLEVLRMYTSLIANIPTYKLKSNHNIFKCKLQFLKQILNLSRTT